MTDLPPSSSLPNRRNSTKDLSSSLPYPTTAQRTSRTPIALSQCKPILHPAPKSFPLQAACMLLSEISVEQYVDGVTVYLVDLSYMLNWLIWCLHQKCSNSAIAAAPGIHPNSKSTNGSSATNEHFRLQEGMRLIALQYQLPLVPTLGMPYTNPGPLQNAPLSQSQEEPLLLSTSLLVYQPNVEPMWQKSSEENGHAVPSLSEAAPLVKHTSYSTVAAPFHSTNGNSASCMIVPERFYNLLRSTHGICCDDFHSISFQSPLGMNGQHKPYLPSLHHINVEDIVLHHHPYNDKELHYDPSMPRPIEFRRKVLYQTGSTAAAAVSLDTTTKSSNRTSDFVASATSLMEKLLLEQQIQQRYLLVEVYPVQLFYSFDPKNDSDDDGADSVPETPVRCGYILISRDTPAVMALMALQNITAPHKVKQCIRLWSQWIYEPKSNSGKSSTPNQRRNPTSIYDGYELVEMEQLTKEKNIPIQQLAADMVQNGNLQNRLLVTLGAWVDQHFTPQPATSLDILIETRRTIQSPWPRKHLELAQRLQVGDYVDAQDVAGQWYEAVVREIDQDTVLVHYSGWASRWDIRGQRRNRSSEEEETDAPLLPVGTELRIKAPVPLWSQSGRWRERLQIGDTVEVRDSSSIVERPKWYKGIVQAIGQINDPPRDLVGGAEVEHYACVINADEVERRPLLILNRAQQILVEVEQERTEKPLSSAPPVQPSSSNITESIVAEPPHLRWVNLFGEEICRIGTHLKESKDEGPVTLRYEFDSNRKPVSVMKSHPGLGAGFVRESLRGTPTAPGSVGLHNLGNSCFMNSTLQCLNHLDLLTQYFIQDRYSKDLNRKNPLGSGGNVAVAYASLLKKIWAGNHSVLVPRVLKQTVANFAPQFDNSYQHDSHEFCQFLMDGLHEDLNRVKTKPYVEELEGFGMEDQKAAIESWRKHLLRHDSIVVDHFQGMHRSHLTCPQCSRESIKFDVYSSISLPLPTQKNMGTIMLEDCIEKFMEAEQLDERDAYYCPNCRRHVCALKLIALWTIPDILILHLKRFTFDTCMLSGGMLRSKIDNKVEFPINNLDLTKIMLGPIDPAAPPIYNLFGVSEHIGATANSGHYTATVRNSVDGQWYRCNDSQVGLTSGEASITGGAYLLFYQRAKGTTKWGGMYRQMKELNIDPYGAMDPVDEEGFRQVKTKKKKK
jgi:ubiquitin carboxyl-terminal hydrolase 8